MGGGNLATQTSAEIAGRDIIDSIRPWLGLCVGFPDMIRVFIILLVALSPVVCIPLNVENNNENISHCNNTCLSCIIEHEVPADKQVLLCSSCSTENIFTWRRGGNSLPPSPVGGDCWHAVDQTTIGGTPEERKTLSLKPTTGRCIAICNLPDVAVLSVEASEEANTNFAGKILALVLFGLAALSFLVCVCGVVCPKKSKDIQAPGPTSQAPQEASG